MCACVRAANVCRRRRAEICSQFGLKLKAGESDNFEVMCVLCCMRYGLNEIVPTQRIVDLVYTDLSHILSRDMELVKFF